MATKHNSVSKRFMFRSSDKNNKVHPTPKNEATHNMPSKTSQSRAVRSLSPTKISPTPRQTNGNNDSPRTETVPVRRVVLVRNTRNPHMKQGPVDLSDFEKNDPKKIVPAVTNGHTSIYLIRRSIVPANPVG
ncbi:unnamed protein product [Rotaria socialis]|uniref:Uncharacterized protein n=2 Tax=Rotaria socialis TaxID=392032 RepID=A0A818WFP7_9BILA|nr:unnamed protein product [Rotaria socialis]